MNRSGEVSLSGARAFKVIRANMPKGSIFRDVWRNGLPHFGLGREVNLWRLKNLPNLLGGAVFLMVFLLFQAAWFMVARAFGKKPKGFMQGYGRLYAVVHRANGEVQDFGVASYRVVCTTGVNAIVDAFQGSFTLSDFKYHGFGTGTTAEAASDSALVTELTTQYASDNVRPTGSQTEGASAWIYRTVGTLSPDATVAITEHGIFNQAANSGGTLLDRSKFAAINLVSGDSLATTYDLTMAAAG